MKNIKNTLFVLFGMLTLASCSDDVEDRPVITATDAPTLTAPDGGAYVLAIENASAQAERFVWTPANFDQDVAIIYTVEIDLLGNEFANPQSLGSVTGDNNLSVSVESLNGAALLVGGEAFVEDQFEVRVRASVNDTFESMYSNTVTISVTPYVSVVPPLFLVGSPQGHYGLNEWDNTTAMPLRYIGDGVTRVYEAYVKVGVGQGFKFIGEQGTWDNGNYGTIGGVQDGNLENGGGSSDIFVANDGDGLYYVWVDIDNLEYKAVKMNWGIIGNATPGGWDSETPMTYDFATNTYSISTVLADGELKFRSANTGQFISGEDWKFNVGDSDPMVTYNPGAPNFQITGGPHNITLSLNLVGEATVTGL